MRRCYLRSVSPLAWCAVSFSDTYPSVALKQKIKRRTAQVVPGELAIVTGVPNSGKSEFIDALLCNLSENEGWSFAMCSMEKKVR